MCASLSLSKKEFSYRLPALLFSTRNSLLLCRTMFLVPREAITPPPPPRRRSHLLHPRRGARTDGGHLGNRRLHKAPAEDSNPAAQLRRNGLVRRVALHHWLSALEFLERRSGHHLVALLHRLPHRRSHALIADFLTRRSVDVLLCSLGPWVPVFQMPAYHE